MFDESRDRLILERRKGVAQGDNNLGVGNYFTHSFNMGCGDRSFMQCVWRVVSLTAQQVYAECVLNVEKIEEANDMFRYVGRRHMFDRGEYQFYDATDLYNTIIAERQQALEAATKEKPEAVDEDQARKDLIEAV